MPPKNPLEIPEIANMMAPYLEGEDLASCVLVSKSWHDTFLPLRWRVVRVGMTCKRATGRYALFGPNRDSVNRYRHLIQDLSLVRERQGLDEYDYPKVRRLAVDTIYSTPSVNHITMDFAKSTPLLVDLKMANVYHTHPAFWEKLSEHPHLRTLTISDMRIEPDDTPGLWKTCMKLESLQMDHVSIEDTGRPRNVGFYRMRKLSMMGGDVKELYQLDLILLSPILESLEWEITNLMAIAEQSLSIHWPRLKRLHIDCRYHAEEDLAYILEDIGKGQGGLIEFGFSCPMGTQSSRALSIHFSTLVKVDLRYSSDRSDRNNSLFFLDILCSCPRLEVLLVGSVHAKDVVECGPWVCQQLRELEIWFKFAEAEQDHCPLVFEHLSTLTQLEHLKLNYAVGLSRWDGFRLMKFRLDDGLASLTSLWRLRSLDFGSTIDFSSPELSVEEVTWMVDNWKKLEVIKGPLNSNTAVAAQLKEIIESHGIATS